MSAQRIASSKSLSTRLLVWAIAGVAGGVAVVGLGGCSSPPQPIMTGFLTDYSNLAVETEYRSRYTSLALGDYSEFMVDPVKIRSDKSPLDPEQRAEVAIYFRDALIAELRDRGYTVTDGPGFGVARIRVAITNVNESTWWQKIHPASSLAGAGRGGAAMEGEVIDSITGDQVAAVVQSGVGSQFTLGNFSTLSDIRNVIDTWVDIAVDRLDALHGR